MYILRAYCLVSVCVALNWNYNLVECERVGRGSFYRTVALFSWRYWGKSRKTIKVANVRVEHRSRVLNRTSREYHGDIELTDAQKHSQISP